jgi:hypothetical protein
LVGILSEEDLLTAKTRYIVDLCTVETRSAVLDHLLTAMDLRIVIRVGIVKLESEQSLVVPK